MTGKKLRLPLFFCLLVLVLPATIPSASAGAEPQMNRARVTVEQSMLSPEEKQLILTAGDRAIAAGVPQDDAGIIITRALQQGTGAARTAEFLEIAGRLRYQGLPVRLVLDRIEQGLAKGVPPERIAMVVQKLSEHIAAARPLVQKIENTVATTDGASGPAVETVARALEKSISAETILRTGDKVREQKGSLVLFGRAVDTITSFAGNGMTAENASRLVHTAMDRGYSERDLEAMERYMVDELRRNRPIRDVVSGMEARMERSGMRGSMDRQGGAGTRGPGSGGAGPGPGMGNRR